MFKIYGGKQTTSGATRWASQLVVGGGDLEWAIVNADTGERIATLGALREDGVLELCSDLRVCMENVNCDTSSIEFDCDGAVQTEVV